MYVRVLIQRASLSPSVFQDFPGLLISGNHFPGYWAVSAQARAVHGGSFKFGGGVGVGLGGGGGGGGGGV